MLRAEQVKGDEPAKGGHAETNRYPLIVNAVTVIGRKHREHSSKYQPPQPRFTTYGSLVHFSPRQRKARRERIRWNGKEILADHIGLSRQEQGNKCVPHTTKTKGST